MRVLVWGGWGRTDVGPLDLLGHPRRLRGHEENRSKEEQHQSIAPRKIHRCAHTQHESQGDVPREATAGVPGPSSGCSSHLMDQDILA